MIVKKIPLHVQTLLSASVCINNYKRAIEELVYNSLDAESTSIAVRVNIEENFIQILDNGSGIEKSNLTLLGVKYATSKYINITTLKSAPDKYGFRGLSLASIIEISQDVKISSKVDNSNETWIKNFYKGKEKSVSLHSDRPSKGTTVEIIGFLYNLKIQKKSTEPVKELQHIKLYLQQLSLVHCNVSISLRDDSKNEIIFTINKKRDIYQTLRSLFKIQQNDLCDVQVEKSQYKVRGFIAKNKENTKNCQWIYLNGRIINKTAVHKKINTIFNKMGNILTHFGNKKNKNVPADENYLFHNSPPNYFIFISCPNLDFDIIYKNNVTIVEFHNWQEIEKLLEKLIKFYSGDLNLKLLSKTENIIQHNKKCNDTRKKVKQIMEKILNNHANKPKISQFKKGVKGKNVKRKKEAKIKIQDISTKKNTISKINLLKKTFDLTKIIDKKLSVTPKCKDNNFKGFNSMNKYLNVKNKKHSDYKTLKQNIPLKEAKDADINNHRKIICKQNIKDLNYKKVKSYKNKKLENDFSPKRKYISEDYYKQNYMIEMKKPYMNKFEVKTSYDLIKPAEIFQTYNTDPITENQHIFLHQQTQSYVATCETYFPKTTFDSHNYNKEIGQKKNVMKQFISSNSCKNFLLHENCIHKRKVMYETNNLKKNKRSSTKKIINDYDYIPPYINESMKTKKSSTFCDNIETSNVRSIDIKEKYISQDVGNEKKSGYNMDINYENTYTIDMKSLSLFTYNSNYNKTYRLQKSNNLSIGNKSLHSFTVFTQNETFNSNVGNNLNNSNNIISEFQTLEPLNYCETVFQADKCSDFEKVKSFFNKNYMERIDQLKSTNKAVTNKELVNNCELIEEPKYDKIVNDSNMSDKSSKVVIESIEPKITHVDKQNVQEILTEEKGKSDCIAIECDNINNFELKRRHSFVPKGMSPIFYNNYKMSCVVDNVQDYYEDDVYKKFADDVLNNCKIFEPEIENIKDVVSKDLKRVNNRLNKDNADLIFDCSSLNSAEVLGQVDAKFILAIIKGKTSVSDHFQNFLALFDQHAVDERIRLENNLKDYLNGNEWSTVSINSVIKLKLSQEDYFYVYNHKEKFNRFGLQWTFENNELSIHAIPTAILGKNIREVEIIMKAVKSLFSELIDAIKTLRGNVASYPKSIMNLICSEACRYATKFGDKLSKNDCVNLISALSRCQTPFQCAHGRPAMAILTELTDKETNYTVNFNKIKGLRTMTTLQ